jgi:acetolactate synthase-1/2/3 large subunit
MITSLIYEEAMNTAELLVKCLENEGVEYIFGLPGEENMAVLNALENSSIKFITTRHEQGAAFMAQALLMRTWTALP